MSRLLVNERLIGIIAPIGDLALPFYCDCRRLILNIPDDVMIISFSNLKTAALLNPSHSTITQPVFDIGKEAASKSFKILNKKHFEQNEMLVLKSMLIQRESTWY